MTLSSRILFALILGVGAGLFFGEPMGALAVAGDAFVRLLQMTVLPYVMVSLVAGLGHLDYAEARSLSLRGGLILVLLWAVSFAMAASMALVFPSIESASFFSSSLTEPSPQVDFLGLYIPSNPFHSLANNVVPAVVLFSICLGAAVIGVEGKASLVRGLDTLGAALLRVTDFVVRLTPFGVFAIGASAAGTMTVDEFEKVQVYLLSYIVFSLILTFWLLPGLVSALTTIRHRDVIWLTRDALVTAFATGSVFVVIPLLAERSRELLQRYELETEDSTALINVIIPVSNSFPHAAKVLTLSFVIFAGWFADTPIPLSQYPILAASGIASSFASANVAIPFLLDLMRLPHDLFQLFIATGVLNARFGTLLAAMHVLVLSLLGVCALTGSLRLRWGRLVRFGVTTLAVVGLALLGTRLLLVTIVDDAYHDDQIVWTMHLTRDTVPAVVHADPPATPAVGPVGTRLSTILERGVLRVGYRPEGALPMNFRNAEGERVGLDVEMAHSLARGLGVSLEFVPVSSKFGANFGDALASGYCDIVMSRAPLTLANVGVFEYSQPYLDLTIGFIVRDHRRTDFLDRERLAQREDMTIAMPDAPYYRTRIARLLPGPELVTVTGMEEFLADESGRFDGMVFVAELASAWTLLRPEFTTVVPEPPLQGVPMAYPLPLGETAWKNVVDNWIVLKRGDGTIDQLYDHWILGRTAKDPVPRWSVARDVLGWMD
ncbi:MAG: cation:dicarboxylase symporter family transporter [Deltaproteobacteria bacterium]|nr:cation:dicarboxylase symporter family transporter [Deltaproteobacteria bacterium]